MTRVHKRSQGIFVLAGTFLVLMARALHAQAAQSQPTPQPSPEAPAASATTLTPASQNTPAKVAAKTIPELPAAPAAHDEIVVTAVGDIMLRTTFPPPPRAHLPP